MKVVFPKNIKRGIIAGMTINIGPLSLTIIQLFIVAGGVGAGVAVFNAGVKSGSKALGILMALPIIGIFLIIAFFKVSELSLLAFVGKKLRNNFFDTTRKFQTNYERPDPFQILLKMIAIDTGPQQKIEQKQSNMVEDELLERIENGGLL